MRRKDVAKMTGAELKAERAKLLPVVRREQARGVMRSKNYRRYVQVTGEIALRTDIMPLSIEILALLGYAKPQQRDLNSRGGKSVA